MITIVAILLAGAALPDMSRGILERVRSGALRSEHILISMVTAGGFVSLLLPAHGVDIILLSVALAAMVAVHNSYSHLGPANKRSELLAILMLVSWIALRQLAVADEPLSKIYRPGVSILLWTCVIVICRRTGRPSSTFVARIFAGGLAFAIVAGRIIGTEWRPCREDKCAPGGRIYAGIFGSENGLALVAAISLVYNLSATDSRRRRSTRSLLSLLLLVLTGSRTSELALVLSIGLAAALGATVHSRGGVYQLSKAASAFFAALMPAVGMTLVLTATATEFTNRGRLWRGIATSLGGLSTTGSGITGWAHIQVQLDTILFPHSEYALLYVYGGWTALVLFSVALYHLVHEGRFHSRAQLVAGIIPVVTLTCLCLTEEIWNPGSADFLTWMTVIVAVATPAYTTQWPSRSRQWRPNQDQVHSRARQGVRGE